jgi:hypothetical protein
MDESRSARAKPSTGEVADREAWLSFHKELVAGKQNAISKFDSAILAVSGALLSFSVGFLRGSEQTHKGLLLAGWTLLALAVACSVISHLVAWFAGKDVVEEVAQICRGESDPSQVDFGRGGTATTLLNIASCGSLVAGVFLLVGFAYTSM